MSRNSCNQITNYSEVNYVPQTAERDNNSDCTGLIESMMVLRLRQGNLRLVFRLFSLMRGLPSIRLNNLEMSRRFPCRGLNPIIDYFSYPLYFLKQNIH